jgi:hypothetical protein
MAGKKQDAPRVIAPKISRVAETSQPGSTFGADARSSRLMDRSAIARRAYERFVARGGAHGHDLEDWLEAEHELNRRNYQPDQGMQEGA